MKAIVSFVAMMVAAGVALADLPRRATLGVALQANAGGEGLKISQSLNPKADLQSGDVMLAIDGKPVTGPDGVAPSQQLYGRKIGDNVKVTIVRAGAKTDVSVALIAAPPPMLEGRPVEMGEAAAPGGPRVRTYFYEPADKKKLARGGKLPAVMILPGIPCGTVETFANPNQMYTKFFRALSAAGVIAVMADKPGQGDSEGVRCEIGGFDAEEQAFRAAAKKFVADKRIDPKRFFLVGLSLGGIQAPLVAESAPAAGIITWGTGVTFWHDYLLTTFHRRAVLQGEDPATAMQQALAWRQVLAAIYVQNKTPSDIAREMPAQHKIVTEWAGSLENFAGRAWAFHREIDKAPVIRAWNAHKGKLLALHGEFDWVAEKHDHRLAVDIVNRNRPGDAAFEIVPGNDHGATKHATEAESFAKAFQGTPDDTIYARTVAWVTEIAGK